MKVYINSSNMAPGIDLVYPGDESFMMLLTMLSPWIEKPMKTSLDQYFWFSENRSVTFKNNYIFKKFENSQTKKIIVFYSILEL
jgi:hypothetical protein